MGRALQALGLFCARRSLIVIAIWVLIGVGIFASVAKFGSETSNDLALPGTESQQVKDLLAKRFPPQQNGVNPIVFNVGKGSLTSSANSAAVKSSVKALRSAPHVFSVTNPLSNAGQSAGLLSKDRQTGFAPVLLNISGGQLDDGKAQAIFDAVKPAEDAGITVAAAGSIGSELSAQPTESSDVVGILAAMLILTLVLGSLIAMGLPILAAIVGLGVALAVVGLLGHVVSMPDTGATLATMIGLGVGIDYALFLISRHQDQLKTGTAIHESIARAVATSGSAIVFAGGTVVVALLSLRVAGIPLLSTLGLASAVAVVTAVLASITFLPAVLGLLGARVNSLGLPGFLHSKKPGGGGLWHSWASFLARHPLWVTVASLAFLVPLIAPAPSLRFGQEDIGATSPTTTERQAYDLMTAGFGVGYNGPLQVAANLSPPAAPSDKYTKKYDKATSLQKELEKESKQLPKEKKRLEAQQRQLEQQKKDLQSQQAGLQRQQAQLEAEGGQLSAQQQQLEQEQASLEQQAAALSAQAERLPAKKARLEAQQRQLQAEQARLQAKRDALAQQARALAARVRPLAGRLALLLVRERILERRIAELDDQPILQAILEARLERVRERQEVVRARLAPLELRAERLAERARTLAAQAYRLQAKASRLQARADQLQQQADELSAQKAALQQQGEALQAQATELSQEADLLNQEARSLQQQADQLQLEGTELQQQADRLQAQAKDLKSAKRQATQQKKQAKQLQKQLTQMVTIAGGDPRNTDPRVVGLQNGLTRTSGVLSLTPPQTNNKGDVVLLSAIATTGPATVATTELLATVRDNLLPNLDAKGGMTTYVGGYTASYVDLASLISGRLLLVIGTVILLGFVLLMVAFRSILVPLQAAITNVLSAAAAFGILTAVFQWGWGISLVGIDTASGSVPIASYVPLMMFAVLFGLSMDYEVFLVSHMQQHHLAGEPAQQASASGLSSSGRITTAACLIMTSVFASFVLNGDPTIKQFGVGLASAVLLAGILVVTLAPATITLMGEAAWWLPKWLDRLLPHINVEGERAPGPPTPAPAFESADVEVDEPGPSPRHRARDRAPR